MKKIAKVLASLAVATTIAGQSVSASAVSISEGATYTVQAYDYDTAPFGEKLIAVKKEGKWGFMNVSGEMTIKPIYDRTYNFSNGLAAVKKNGKWGFVNKQGKEIIKPQFTATAKQFSNGYVAAKKGSKWGLINKNGKTVVSFKYQEIGGYSEGLVNVKQGNKYGFVNLKNKMVIKPQYQYVLPFSEGITGVLDSNGNVGTINKAGKTIIPLKYSDFYSYDNGYAVVQDAKGLFGVVNKAGKVVVPFKYQSMTEQGNGIVGYTLETKKGYDSGYLNVKNGKKAFSMTPTNSELMPFTEGLAFYSATGTGVTQYVYTTAGKKIKLKNKYTHVMYFNNGYALGAVDDNFKKFKVLKKK